MPFEILHLLKTIELDGYWDGTATFTLGTDLPGDAMAIRLTKSFTYTGRRTVTLKGPGSTRLKLLQATLSGTQAMKLFGARVLARPLGQPGAQTWEWYSLPVRVTPDLYSAASLPIRPTQEGFAVASLPIRETSEAFSAARLPIRATPDEWSEGALPLPQVSPIPRWVDIPVDRIE